MAQKKHFVLNETRMMKCGKNATCIIYRKSSDIDVQFEDGVIVLHRNVQSFLNGAIRHPLLSRTYSRVLQSSCEGKTVMQNCGMAATCIAYRSARDIDIQFNDGFVVAHRSKGSFLNGGILHPKMKKIVKGKLEKASCLGQKRLMNNGMMATCVAYRGWHDVDVQFEEGTLVQHRKKSDFLHGNIQSPNWWEKSFPQRVIYECVKEHFPSALLNYRPVFLKNEESGVNLELDIWIPEISCGIEYDGFPWHRKETDRSKKKYELVLKSNEIKNIFTFIEKDCIEHHSPKHINIKLDSNHLTSNYPLLEEGINKLFKYLNIKERVILDDKKLNAIREKCNNQNLGMAIKQNCGMVATCITYRSSNDIDVQFDDGTIVSHRNISSFTKGMIKNPVLYEKEQREKTVGQRVLMVNNMYATCIEYQGCNNLTVQFEDGTIVNHIQKSHFMRGAVKHPNINAANVKASCVGLKLKMNNNMFATCIAYRDERDIDIQFEDGTIVTHKRKGNFVRGEIENPNFNRHSCLGKTYKQCCGLNATCIAYRGCNDIDVKFQDGIVVKNLRKRSLIEGHIKHPMINTKKERSSCIGLTKRMNCGLLATCIEYRNSKDIDIQFEDGLIVEHKKKSRFLRGSIAHKKFQRIIKSNN